MKKRLLSALLVLVMVLTMLPATVFAADGDATPATITIPLSLGNATWASGDSISVTSDGSTSLSITITPTFAADGTQEGWSASGAPQGYDATYNGTSLVLTAQNAGATSLTNVYGTISASVNNNDANQNSTTVSCQVGQVSIQDGTDASNNGSQNQGGNNSPDWSLPSSTNATATALQTKWTAKYITTDAAATSKADAITGTPGWYATKVVDGITKYYRIKNGYVVGSTWYATVGELPASYSTITVFDGTVTVPAKGTSLTVDVYPNDTGATSLSISGSGLTNLTITDSKYRTEFRDRSGVKANVTLDNTWAANKSVTLKMTDVDCSGISLTDPYAHTVTLENVNVTGNITLNGRGQTVSGTKTTQVSAKQTLNVNTTTSALARANNLGAVSVTGNTSAVNITDATATSVNLTGANTSLTVDGANASVGNITIDEGNLITSTTTALTKISVQNATVGNISFTGSNTLTGNATISVTGKAGDIDMSSVKAKPVITVPGGTTGAISVAAGTVTVSGSYAKLGAVTLDGSASFTMTGTNHTVTSIAANNSNVKISVPAEPSNTLAMEDGDALNLYKGHGIQGGTWKTHPVPAAALNTSLVYELKVDSANTYTYYNASQLNQALVSQYQNAGSNGTGSGAILCAVGQSTKAAGTANSDYYTMVFMNGKTLWGTMRVTGEMRITLPTLINTVTVTKWADKFRSNWPAGGAYSTPKLADVPADTNGDKIWELNASGGITNGDITKITDVSVKNNWNAADAMGDVKATLSGNVISLSGAVPAGISSMTLYLTTDAIEQAKNDQGIALDEDVPVTLAVGLTYYSDDKSLNFSNVANDSLTHGATLEFDTNTSGVLRLSNGTKYTLNGSGLKERSDNITVVDSSSETDWFNNNFIEVSVNVSTLKTQAAKDEVIALLNGTEALYKWTDSPAVREAVNAALATITDSQVATWIKTAKTNAWKKVNSGTPTESDLNETGYDDAFLVPYLQVNVTAYNPNGTLTATLVPSWRVEVRQTGAGTNNRYSTAFADAKNPNLPGNVYVAKAGAAMTLGTNVSEIEKFDNLTSGVVVKLSSDSAQLFSTLGNIYMHQDSTYAYKMDAQGGGTGYLIRHAGSGSGLGTVTINTTEPLIKLYSSNAANAPLVAYFDTLQAAVNDAQDKQHIDVDQNYKGSMSVNVTGYARTFTIQANGQNVVVANASGGMVSLNNTGSEYTVQLNRDNTAVVDSSTATIAVAQVANGSAGVSVTTAKAGATVTVTCTPAAGYRTNAVTVSAHMTQNNTNVAVTVTKVSDNVYTFKVPEGADTITVTPAFVVGTAAAAIPFTDVATNHWAYNSVKYVYDNGLMNGVNTAGTQFGGNQSLTRAMVVTILYRAAGSPYVGTTSSFSDVASNTWYSQAVAWANQNNIVTGYLNGTFQPTWDITRQELATILYRYNTSYKGRATTGSTTLTGFPDQGNVSDWATASMQWAVGNGIVNGITNGTTTTLSPAGNATRYEAATMLMRYGQGLGL